MTMCGPEVLGADPAKIKWSVIRGDTASLTVEFLENDEKTGFDLSDWTVKASAYDPKTDILDELTTVKSGSSVIITAPADITALWGTTYSSTVAELIFDLQVVIDNDVTWTPVIGTISVIGDVSIGGL